MVVNVNKKKRTLFAVVAAFFTSVLTLAVVLASGGLKGDLFPTKAGQSYQLKLDSSNAVTSSGTFDKYTVKGGKVAFTYSSATGSSGNHVRLNSGGTLVNHDQITSIESFKVVFSGASGAKLQVKTSYDGATWSDPWDLTNNETYYLSSNPYYTHFSATGGYVDISSITYQYTCVANPDAAGTEIPGETYWARVSSLSELVAGSRVIIAGQTAEGAWYSAQNQVQANYYIKAATLTVSSDTLTAEPTDNNTIWTVQSGTSGTYRFVSGSSYIYGYKSGSYYDLGITSTASDANWTLTISNSNVDMVCGSSYMEPLTHNNFGEFKAYSSPQSTIMYLYIETTTESHTEYDVPVDSVGFEASDSNKNSYTTNSTFATDNDLVVKAVYNDGSKTTLPDTSYSYVITNESGVEIDPTAKFPLEGTYTLTVSYANYIPQEITLLVGEYVYATDISVNIVSNEFTTADRMSEHLTGNVTALVGFNNGNETEITYANFASNNLGVKLLTPKGFSYDMTTPFGSEGTWRLRVYSLLDESIKGDINVFVAAIPVTSITLNDTAISIVVEGTHNLVATVGPNTATNTAVVWASNNEAVATVNQEGLVTAVAVGKANITATAADGSGIVGTCSVTVTAKPQIVSDTLTRESTGIPNQTGGTVSYSSWSGVSGTSGAVYAGNSAGDKNSIQLRSNNNNSGIVTTTSGGKISKVTVSWNSNTSNGRTLNVYGKSSAYSQASDLYTSSTAGTLLGTIVCGTSTELSISGDYEYVGVRSAASAMYLDSIKFDWGGSSSATVPVYPTSISLSSSATNNTISIGGTTQLTTSFEPLDTNVKNVTYSSNKTNIATVSSSGVVTGVAAGTATITAKAEAESGTISATINIQVTTIAVTGITLDKSSASVKVGKTVTLVANVAPSDATNKTINWTTTNNLVASVSGGVVTGVGAGTATITATTADGGYSKTCVVTVTASASSGWELVTSDSSLAAGDVIVLASSSNGVTNGDISSQIMGTVSSTFSSDKSAIEELGDDSVALTLGGSSGAWTLANDEGQLLGVTAVKKLAWDSGTTTWSISISGGDATIQSTNDSYGKFLYNTTSPRFTTYTSAASSTMLLPQIYRGGTAEPTNPTSIILSKTSAELSPGGSTNISVSYVPSNANQNKDITWTSSNTNVATVDSTGKVTAKSTASVGQTATITAKLTNITSVTATCQITIIEAKNNNHTVLIYMCGADLESGTDTNGNVPSAKNASGLASGDIDEILSVADQPDDVNIVIETGGANIWQSGHSYSISNSKLERWHIENKTLVKDSTLTTYASMGLASTFRSFLEWGLTNYPADRTGVILWNHGGGMHGVCYDEKKNDDSLTNKEVNSAVSGALSNSGMSGQKLEWIGYDACLMAVQDIAEFNSSYFNYQISSEESEAGYGWDYDNWVDNLYEKETTPQILEAICTSFINDNGGVNKSTGDQTLSYLDLSYMSAYKTAWENMASQLGNKLTSDNSSSFTSAITSKVKHFADDDYDYFCLFDAYDFVDKLASNSSFNNYKIDSSYTTAVKNAFNNLVKCNIVQKGAGNAYGLCMYWPNNSTYSYISGVYDTDQTNFTTWQGLCSTYGTYKY